MRTRWLARLIAAACWAVPAAVGVSRLYRGMHYPSDVLFSKIGGGLWLTTVLGRCCRTSDIRAGGVR